MDLDIIYTYGVFCWTVGLACGPVMMGILGLYEEEDEDEEEDGL